MSDFLSSSRAAAELDIPSETLRYWERAGLIDPVERDSGRRRRYSASDFEYINVVRSLRATGMPIREVRRFTELVRQGEGTVGQRLEMLRAHAVAVTNELHRQQAALAIVAGKIDTYETMA